MITQSVKRITSSLESYWARHSSRLSTVLAAFTGVALVAMVLVTVVDAVGRKFSLPLPGSYETGTFLLSILFFCSLAYCSLVKGHFVIDIVTNRLSAKTRMPIATALFVLSAIASWMVAFQLVRLAIDLYKDKVTGTELTNIPVYPFAIVGAFCLVVTGAGFLIQGISYTRYSSI